MIEANSRGGNRESWLVGGVGFQRHVEARVYGCNQANSVVYNGMFPQQK